MDLHIKAGDRLYAGGPGVVEAIDTSDGDPKTVWRAEIDGTPQRMLAADEKLFVVTTEGTILAFGQPDEVVHHEHTLSSPPPADSWTEKAAAILKATDVRDGYAVVMGIESGRLVEELVRQSELHLIAIDENAAKVAALRQRLYEAGLYGTRASVLVGDPVTYPLPPYLASLIVSETPDALEQVDETALATAVFHALRPYGGVACVWGALADQARMEEIMHDEEAFHGACVRQAEEFVLLARSGALPGAADWSHDEANAARTGASEDKLQAPTAVLWFDASHRWHRQPGHLQVRVSGGRLLILEAGLLRATDVYTGRELWAVDLPIGQAIPDPVARPGIHRQPSRPRSLAAATELVALEDAIYLTDGSGCKVLDPTTGETATRFELPESLTAAWSNLRACGDHLVGTSGANVVCVDRRTGELLWKFETGRAALSLAVGGGRVFVAELADPRRGEDETVDGLTRALDIATGEPLWEQQGGVQLRYSAPLDLLVTGLLLRAVALNNTADVDHPLLPAVAAVGRVDHYPRAVLADPRMEVAAPLAPVLGGQVKPAQHHRVARGKVEQVENLLAIGALRVGVGHQPLVIRAGHERLMAVRGGPERFRVPARAVVFIQMVGPAVPDDHVFRPSLMPKNLIDVNQVYWRLAHERVLARRRPDVLLQDQLQAVRLRLKQVEPPPSFWQNRGVLPTPVFVEGGHSIQYPTPTNEPDLSANSANTYDAGDRLRPYGFAGCASWSGRSRCEPQ